MFKSPIKTVAYGNQMTEESDVWWDHFQPLFLNLFKLLSSISPFFSLSLLSFLPHTPGKLWYITWQLLSGNSSEGTWCTYSWTCFNKERMNSFFKQLVPSRFIFTSFYPLLLLLSSSFSFYLLLLFLSGSVSLSLSPLLLKLYGYIHFGWKVTTLTPFMSVSVRISYSRNLTTENQVFCVSLPSLGVGLFLLGALITNCYRLTWW